MKRFILMALVCLMSLGAAGEIRFRSIDNFKDTNVVLIDKDAPKKVEITDAVFFNNGIGYPAKQIRCDIVDGIATYRLKFKRFTVFKNCKVVLTVNGKEVTVDIQKNISKQ